MLINMACAIAGAPVRQAWIAMHAAVFVLLLLGAWLAFATGSPDAGTIGESLGRFVLLGMVTLELIYFAAFLFIALRSSAAQSEERAR